MISFNNTGTRSIHGFGRCVNLCAKHAVMTVAITGTVLMLTGWSRKYP